MKEYFKRKIDSFLHNWLHQEGHSPLLVYGLRQCGKSWSLKHFASSHFQYVNTIDFWKKPEAIQAFEGSLEVDDLLKKISSYYPKFVFVPGKSVLILDEIQDCPRARLAFKSFKEDGRFEIMASGSYIGLNLAHDSKGTPKPNGNEDLYEMKTMDFEEFLWAKGFGDDFIGDLVNHARSKTPVEKGIHAQMKALYKDYLCVGGYPEVVSIFFRTNSFGAAYRKLRSLAFDIKGDPAKRKDDSGKPLYTQVEVARIQKAFDLIASFSILDNRRYVLSKVSGNGYQRQDALSYLLNSNVAYKVCNVANPSLPLSIGVVESVFKLFYADIGLLMAALDFDTVSALQTDKLGMNKGFIFEAAVGDSLYKGGVPLYYFSKEGRLEIDFVISFEGKSTLVEAKATDGNTKSSKTVMKHPEHYGPTRLLKFADCNIGAYGDNLTLPYYLAFAIGKLIEESSFFH